VAETVEIEMDEKSLAEVSTVDTTPTITPEDFSFEDFLEGVRPTRRSVLLYPRGDLIARMDEIATLIETADDDANVDDLIDEYEQVKKQFRQGIWFTLEKRSSEWAEKFRVDTEKSLGLKRSKDDTLSDEDATTVSIHQLAQQIVVPSGVSVASLRRLAEVNEGEFNKLVYTMIKANSQLAEDSTDNDKREVLSRDFSQRRSGNR
jgi:hypothetical protein